MFWLFSHLFISFQSFAESIQEHMGLNMPDVSHNHTKYKIKNDYFGYGRNRKAWMCVCMCVGEWADWPIKDLSSTQNTQHFNSLWLNDAEVLRVVYLGFASQTAEYRKRILSECRRATTHHTLDRCQFHFFFRFWGENIVVKVEHIVQSWR